MKSLRLLVVLVGMLALVPLVRASSSASYILMPDVQSAGGQAANSVNYMLVSTLGQPTIGLSSSANHTACSGYWCQDTVIVPIRYRLMLPLTQKNHVSYFEGTAEAEDNDVYTSANGPLRSGRDYSGRFDDEKDYFSINLLEGGTITVDVAHTSANVQLQLFYQDVTHRVKADTAGHHVTYSGAAGWYYIYLNAGTSPDGGAYTLRMTAVYY